MEEFYHYDTFVDAAEAWANKLDVPMAWNPFQVEMKKLAEHYTDDEPLGRTALSALRSNL